MNVRREAILREMGLAPLWRLRTAAEHAPEEPVGTAGAVPDTDAAPLRPSGRAAPGPSMARETSAGAGVAARDPRGDMPAGGGSSSPARPHPVATAPARGPTAGAEGAALVDPGRRDRIAGLDWEALEADIRACTACRLCEKRKQAVPGVGDRQAQWMLVGEGPGAEEDQRGEPFVGAAGKLLDAMLASIGLKRGEGVYIANTVKCRPPLNRTPQVDEIATCFPYLERQIALVRPRVLIALGRPAAQALLGTELSIGASRGRVFQYHDTPLVITYHPAYLLRNQTDKAKAWEDLCFARRVMSGAADARGS